jgi:hypothetical protein
VFRSIIPPFQKEAFLKKHHFSRSDNRRNNLITVSKIFAFFPPKNNEADHRQQGIASLTG